MNNHKSNGEKKKNDDDEQLPYRLLPWACEIVWFPIVLLCATLHYVCKPLGIEPIVASFITGGLFGMVLIPLAFGACIVYTLEYMELISSDTLWLITQWIGIPFAVYYVVFILVLDPLHLSVQNANPHPPRYELEVAATAFLSSFLEYFPCTVVPWEQNATLPTMKQYIFAVHPHGIHCTPLAQFTTLNGPFDRRFPGLVGKHITGLAATVMFKLPLVRELFLHMGYVDASREVASRVLERGRSVLVCIGGAEESMYTTQGKDILVLKKRKGFVRLALSYGAELVPVFGVGNTDLYTVRNGALCGSIFVLGFHISHFA